MSKRTLYLFSSAAPPVFDVARVIDNRAYAAHPPFERSIETLRGAGVRVVYGEGGFVPNEPGKGDPSTYPWHAALEAVSDLR
ncbi:hypothetical protein ACFTWS_36430 [Streptomyces sp. NPDC057027]|uniref:hypothetical protein n=1 Tax=Streptomyces sp. NPDC057027 TaxID=3346004 RepID=UPI003638A1FD